MTASKKRGPMSERVRTHLVASGVMTERGVTKHPRYRHCRCGLVVLAAIDDMLFVTACWPNATTPKGELVAVLAGLRTYTLIADQLVYRAAHRIERRDANAEIVYVQHQCGDVRPVTGSLFGPRAKTEVIDNDAPAPF